ncbi:MAG: glycoside hydrolase family 92 protein [Oscillospiraceae bacterium]|nr:glycoside hydrolase family 92 protein [Oscillospiraceae bacterium]
MDEFIKNGIDFISTYGGRVIVAILVLVIGRFVVKLLMKALIKAIDKLKMDETLKQISKKFLRLLLYFILIISVVEILGVSMSSVIAILASCGLHPSCPGNNVYELTSPVFDRIEIQTSRGPVCIIAHDNGPENIYIQRVSLNGKPLTESHIDITALTGGSRLEFWMGPDPVL